MKLEKNLYDLINIGLSEVKELKKVCKDEIKKNSIIYYFLDVSNNKTY